MFGLKGSWILITTSAFSLLWYIVYFTSGNFVKVHWNVESEIESVNFLNSVTLKSIGLSCTLDFFFLICKYWETVRTHGGRKVCQNSGLFTQKLKFSHWQQILWVFIEVTGWLLSFEKMSIRYSRLNTLSLAHSSENGAPWIKWLVQSCSSNNWTQCFFSRQP